MNLDDDLTRLRGLERATLTACKVCSDAKCLQSVLDPEYMRLRMSMVDTFARVAFKHGLWWETVEYAIAWSDTCRARDKPSARLPVYLAAIACLSLAIKYTTMKKIKHRQLMVQCEYNLDTLWGSTTEPHKFKFTGAQIAAAEYHVAAVLEWTMGAAIPSRFLEVLFAKHTQASDDAGQGRALRRWQTAKDLCKIGVFHGLSCAHGDSVLAAACIATTHSLADAADVAHGDSVLAAACIATTHSLADAADVAHEAELRACVLELKRAALAPTRRLVALDLHSPIP